jgi:hypothetical protein
MLWRNDYSAATRKSFLGQEMRQMALFLGEGGSVRALRSRSNGEELEREYDED